MNKVTLIAGQYRRRHIHFPDIPDLRPTPNRVRETLFNWLAPFIIGSRCLDLFAGSGALGFEALSRGAKEVVFVEAHQEVIAAIQENIHLLGIQNAITIQTHIPEANPKISGLFDIVFLDPPFRQNLLENTCIWLEQQKLLTQQSLIYVESAKKSGEINFPSSWVEIKNKIAGQVRYQLFQRNMHVEKIK